MSWPIRTVGDVCAPVTKMDPAATGRDRVSYVDIGGVDGTRHALATVNLVESASAPSRCRQVLKRGDTVFSTVRPYLEKIAFIDGSLDGEFASTGFCVLRPKDELDSRFLFHFATSRQMLEQVIAKQKGVSYPAVLDREVKSSRIPVPPLAEQRRIVAILEEHLTSLEDAERSLAHAGAGARALSASALSAVRAGGETALTNVADIQGGIQKQAKRAPRANRFPFLRVANVTANGLDLREVHDVELFEGELPRFALVKGDLLVVEGNGSPSQIGRAALWDGSIANCVHQNHLIRVRPRRDKVLPEYLEAVWNSPENRSILTSVSSSSSGLHTLSVRKLAQLQVPLPSLQEQRSRIIEVERAREADSRLRASLAIATARGLTLRRALLAAAFSGRLTGRSSDTDVIDELAEEESA